MMKSCDTDLGAIDFSSTDHALLGSSIGVKEHSRSPIQIRVEGLLRGVIAVLLHHRAPQIVLTSLISIVGPWLATTEPEFMSRAKYFTTLWMARYLRNPEPAAPAGDPLPLRGHWYRWFRSRMRRVSRTNTHLWYSVYQSKRSCEAASEDIIYQACSDHRTGMGTADPLTQADLEELQEIGSRILPVLAQRVRARYCPVWADSLYSCSTGVDEWHASSRACYESSRARGGQLGYLSANAFSKGPLGDLISDRHQAYAFGAIVPGGVETVPVWTAPDLNNQWNWEVNDGISRFYALGEEHYRLTAKIQAVVEPLKVRVISKGPAAEYYASRGLQKALHGVLRELPCFRLIGKPLDSIAVAGIYREGDAWLSGDYKAATDNLSARLSAYILNELTSGQDGSWRNLWRAVLAPHHIEYPEFPGKDPIPPIDQKNGQLMGSILSFPVLCMANLLLFLWFEKKCGREATLASANKSVLINGDDLLARINAAEFPIYKDLAKRVGLPLSVGKTYVHPTVLNVNSTCYHASKTSLYRVDYLNTGLLYGQGKVLSSEEGEIRSVAATFDELVKGALPGRQCEIAAKFLALNRESLLRECTVTGRGHFVRNLFLPEKLGGMGQTPPLGFAVNFTLAQKRVAQAAWLGDPYLWVDHGVKLVPEHVDRTPNVLPWELNPVSTAKGYRKSAAPLGVKKFIGANVYRSLVPRGIEKLPEPHREKAISRYQALLRLSQARKGKVSSTEYQCLYDTPRCDGIWDSVRSDLESALTGDFSLNLELGMEEFRNPLL